MGSFFNNLMRLFLEARQEHPADGGDLTFVPREHPVKWMWTTHRWTHQTPSDHFTLVPPSRKPWMIFLLVDLIPCAQSSWHLMLSKLMRMFCIRNRLLTVLKFFQQRLRDNGSNRGVSDRVEDLDVWPDRLGIFMLGKSCGKIFFVNSYIGDAGNTPLVDDGTLLGRGHSRYSRECWLCTLAVLHPGVTVMWHTHIRDLSPTAEAVREAA